MNAQDTLQSRIIYPESDGKPIGETDTHRNLIFTLIYALQNWLHSKVAYVAGNLFVYYEQGNPASVVCPDVFIALGIPQQDRRTYKTWEHGGKTPDVVVELTSTGTRYEDLGNKRVLYAELGVQEYYIFDPLGEYLNPQLRAYQLVGGELIPIAGSRIFSKLLNLELRVIGNQLRFASITTGELLATPAEDHVARQQEANARQRETEARRAAEAEIEQLRAEIERLRSQSS